MALFHPDDPSYNEGVRQTGFNRYKQLISFHAGNWLKINLLTCLGVIPFFLGAAYAVLSSSLLLMIPASLIGGAIYGPFLSGMVDAIQRGLRDDPGNWWKNYKKSWRQNLKSSLLPGAILGLFLGVWIFMILMLWNASEFCGWGTIALYAFSIFMVTLIAMLYWIQMVLFEQNLLARLRNIILFSAKYLWKILGVTLLQIVWILIIVLLAPLTLVVIPFLGFWYPMFISMLIFYDDLDYELHIEESFFPERFVEEEEDENL